MVSISSYFDSYLQKWCDVSSESEYHSEVGHTVYASHEPTHHHQVDQQGGKDTTERDKEHSDGQTCHSDTQQDVGRNKSERRNRRNGRYDESAERDARSDAKNTDFKFERCG